MATDGRFGLPLIRNGSIQQKKLFLGGFVRLLRNHYHYETGLDKMNHFGDLEWGFGLQIE